VWEWTLADGVRVWFRRSAGDPGRLLVRARAAGGWQGLPSAAPVTLEGSGLRLTLLSEESLVEGEGRADDAAGLAQALAAVLAGRLPERRTLSAEAAIDAALAGRRSGGDVSPSALLARFGRPGAFQVLVSGDIAPDTLIAAVAPVLGRIRAGAELLEPVDNVPGATGVVAQTVQLPADDAGARAIVAFRATLGASSGRRPDQSMAILRVLAVALAAALEADGIRAVTRVDLNGERATLTVEVPSEEPAEIAPAVLRRATDLMINDATVSRARGRVVDAHEREIGRPAGWVAWLDFLSSNEVDPRSIHHFARTVSGVSVDRVRTMAETLLDPVRAGVVLVGGR
jgi:hypothetical protein